MPAKSTPLSAAGQPLALPRIRQISEYHCGPAVLQMLLGQRGVVADQERLTELADVAATIKTNGARVDQLARAVAWLRGGVCLWYKNHATPEDLVAVVCGHRCPAGVEWQGFFEDREEDEDWMKATTATTTRDADPSAERADHAPRPLDFCVMLRVFRLEWFIKRWWDVNEAPAPEDRRTAAGRRPPHAVCHHRGTRARFPASLGMTRGVRKPAGSLESLRFWHRIMPVPAPATAAARRSPRGRGRRQKSTPLGQTSVLASWSTSAAAEEAYILQRYKDTAADRRYDPENPTRRRRHQRKVISNR